jgi:peptidoglycan/xylan/chitin deacetylase (PgdA/CDA1 family)
VGIRTRIALTFALTLPLLFCNFPTNARAANNAPRSIALHVPVLTFHRIAPQSEIGNSLPELVVSPQTFESRLKALQLDGWTTVTAAVLADHVVSGVPLPKKTMVITIDDGRDDGYTYALPILQKLHFVATYYVITGRIGKARYLTVAQLRSMATMGMEIGNHTLHHSGVSGRSDTYYLDEVRTAQQQLTAWLGTPPATFAYPFGLHPTGLIKAVSDVGLRLAFTTISGHSESPSTLLLTPRIRLGASLSPRQVVWKLNHLP